MTIGYFARPFNFKHKSFSTKTHIVENNKVLCGYKPHKTLSFQWCKFLRGSSEDNLDYLECNKCRELYNKKVNYVLK
jgi:hypothetical protein